ncbi:MAG: ABC transporter permease [Chitinophagaceae bacterium]|nr:MAG: ABC transporter permease [Chitinophagaceae bacterium]
MKKIIKYVTGDLLRNKIVLVYMAILFITTISIFSLEDNASKGLLSLLNIVLLIVPLVSIIFSTIYVYNSNEFIELLVSQPLQRKTIWLSLYAGLVASLCIAFMVGTGIPLLIYQPNVVGILLCAVGVSLSIIFVGIAMLAAVYTRDKAKGVGVVILLWLYFSLLFDGLVLLLLFQLADYPMEKPMIGISALNPIDLGRIIIMLQMDVAAMLGYTGAVFKDFFGSATGMAFALLMLLCWIGIPIYWSLRKFKSKDL